MASPGPLQLHMLHVHLRKFLFCIGTWFNRILSKLKYTVTIVVVVCGYVFDEVMNM